MLVIDQLEVALRTIEGVKITTRDEYEEAQCFRNILFEFLADKEVTETATKLIAYVDSLLKDYEKFGEVKERSVLLTEISVNRENTLQYIAMSRGN